MVILDLLINEKFIDKIKNLMWRYIINFFILKNLSLYTRDNEETICNEEGVQ